MSPRREPPWPDRVECFIAAETGMCRVWLRRYVQRDYSGEGRQIGWTCEEGWHQAMTQIRDEPIEKQITDHGYHWHNPKGANGYSESQRAEFPPGHPSWPTHCEKGCGYAFTDEDAYQYFFKPMYVNRDGSHVPLEDLDAGAMFESWWYPDGWKRDGRAVTVMLPDGMTWNIDGEATGGGRWTREGEPPLITANPSIFSCPPSGYHGFLRNGWLERV